MRVPVEMRNSHRCLQIIDACAIERTLSCVALHVQAGIPCKQATIHTSRHTALTEVWPLQTTASECTLVALLAARARQMEGRPLSDTSRLVTYFSDQVRPSCWCCPS